MAAFGPKALAQAGRLGLPYLASPMETLETLVRNYRSHRAAGAAHVDCVPVMRTVYVTEDAAETIAVKQRLASLPRPRDKAPNEVDAWAIVGAADHVREQVGIYREQLGMTHLIATRLRLPGLDPDRVRRSVSKLPELLA